MNFENISISIDKLTPADRKLALGWMNFRIRNYSLIDTLDFPPELMPETGLAAYRGGKVFATAMLYLEKNSPIAVCSFCVTNPENTPAESRAAVEELMKALPLYARELGAKYLLSFFGNRGINHILDKLNFITTEKSENKFKNLTWTR